MYLAMAIAFFLQAVGWIGLACVCADWLLSKKNLNKATRATIGICRTKQEQPDSSTLAALSAGIRKHGIPDEIYVDNGEQFVPVQSSVKKPLPWVPAEEVVANDETRIAAFFATPLVKGKGLKYVSWYNVTPETVTICFSDGYNNEQTEEFDTRDVELSGWPLGQNFPKKNSPREDSPVQLNPLVLDA